MRDGKSDRSGERRKKSTGGAKSGGPVRKEHPFEKFRQKRQSARFPDEGIKGKPAKSEAGHKVARPISFEPREIRLNRYIANSGICSRREADDYILSGHVKVNNAVVTELGTKVRYTDIVTLRGKKLNPERKIYLLLNKPKDYITTVDDPWAKKTVMDLVRGACRERIYPVGRLDRHTTGLLMFTNDGDIAKKLTHPSHKVMKIYHVTLDKPLDPNILEKIAGGIELDDGPVKVDEISFVDMSDKSQVGIRLHSGRNRIVRRIFKYFDYKVIKLDRVFFAGLTKKNLPRGKWRFLDEKEVNRLKMNIFK
jgi:23S rRNA pseudouridine2605 synthase